jgi:hypothetical protein
VIPASAQRAGLWFIHQTDPHCGAYHIVFAAEATASRELGIRTADILADLMREHDALRVAFRDSEHGPSQSVGDAVALDIRVNDARDLDPEVLRRQVRLAGPRIPAGGVVALAVTTPRWRLRAPPCHPGRG